MSMAERCALPETQGSVKSKFTTADSAFSIGEDWNR